MLGGFATLLASGGTFAMFMFRLFVRLESRVDALASELADLRGEVTDLRRDMTHEIAVLRSDMTRDIAVLRGDLIALSREVSELRGEFRGRFDTQPAAE